MLEIFTVLTNGACICSANDELLQTTIANIINTLDINWTFMTPSMIRTVNPMEVPTLKTLALGGEALAKIDVSDIDSSSNASGAFGKMRDDIPHESLSQAAMLQNAPDQAQGQIRVPKVVTDA